MTSQLTVAIDTADLIRFRLQEYSELEGVGQSLTMPDIHIAHLESLREDAFAAECRVDVEAEGRKLRRAQQRAARITVPPVEVVPQYGPLALVPPSDPA